MTTTGVVDHCFLDDIVARRTERDYQVKVEGSNPFYINRNNLVHDRAFHPRTDLKSECIFFNKSMMHH